MSVKKKYPKAEPKQHGSNNIYINAALEAMAQAREENEGLSYMIVVHDAETCGVQMNGDVCSLSAALSHFSKTDKMLHKLVTLLTYGTIVVEGIKTSVLDNFFEALTKDEKLIDGYLDELEKNRPEEDSK